MAKQAKPSSPKQRLHRRAFGLRHRVKQGTATPDETAWLAQYDATVASHDEAALLAMDTPAGEPTIPPAADPALEPETKPAPAVVPAAKPQEVPIVEAPPVIKPPRVLPSVEAPPKDIAELVARRKTTGGRAGDWRDKYRSVDAKGEVVDGRETVCLHVAQLWAGLLKYASDGLELVGVKPLISVGELYGPIVLTVDMMLPREAELTPERLAAAGTVMLATQRLIHHKKIAVAEKLRDSKTAEEHAQADKLAEMRARTAKAEAAYRASQEPPSPPAPPTETSSAMAPPAAAPVEVVRLPDVGEVAPAVIVGPTNEADYDAFFGPRNSGLS